MYYTKHKENVAFISIKLADTGEYTMSSKFTKSAAVLGTVTLSNAFFEMYLEAKLLINLLILVHLKQKILFTLRTNTKPSSKQ